MVRGLTNPLAAVRAVSGMLDFAATLGLSVDISDDFDALVTVRRKARGGTVSPMFDPAINKFSGGHGFWMSATNETGAVISLQAFRLDLVYPDLATWTLGWMSGLYVRRQELILPAILHPPPHSRSHNLSGPLAYHGEMWIDKQIKKREWFDTFLKLGMVLAHIKWQPEALWALIGHTIATHGYVARSGYAVQERGFLQWQWRPEGADHSEWLVIADRQHLEFLINDEAARLS